MMDPEVSDTSLKQVPDPEDSVLELLLAILRQTLGYRVLNMADQAQAPGEGQTGLWPQ